MTNARIAALTNGLIWQFYTDLDSPNRMDTKPFLVLDLQDVDRTLIPEVQKLSKDAFDLESVINAAEELKYLGAIKRYIASEFREPSTELIKFFATKVYEGEFTQRAREQFTPLVEKAMKQFLTDQVNDRLKTALGAGVESPTSEPATAEITSEAATTKNIESDPTIETTLEELEGYQIVKAIAVSEVKPMRIVHRDAKSYFAILLDDNNRKPIARLHFNTRQKYLGVFDDSKTETRHPIESLEEIYKFADEIRASVRRYV